MGRDHERVLALVEADSVDVGYVGDLYALIRAIAVAMPEGSVLELQGTSAPDIQAFVQARAASSPARTHQGSPGPTVEVGLGVARVLPAQSLHLPITRENRAGLRRLAERHAEPEVCDHLVVYEPGRVLMEAWDAGYSHVLLDRHLPESLIERFRRSLWEDGALLPLIVPPIVVDSKSDVFQLYEYTDLLDHHSSRGTRARRSRTSTTPAACFWSLRSRRKRFGASSVGAGLSRAWSCGRWRTRRGTPINSRQPLGERFRGRNWAGPCPATGWRASRSTKLILEALRHHKPR